MARYGNGPSTSSRDALSAIAMRFRRVLLFACRMNHVPPYLFLSREDDDDVRDIGKHDFRSVLLHPMRSNRKKVLSGRERSSNKIIVLGGRDLTINNCDKSFLKDMIKY